MANDAFGDLTDIYDALIDWPKRLANEGPFFRQWFERLEARRVLDAACGTGRHAALFHSWGLEIEGADLSANMIDRARANFGQPPGLRWAVRPFDAPLPAESFDAVVCVGNSLALAPDLETVRCAIAAMLAAVRPGGGVALHVLNLWHLPDGPCVWQKCVQAALPQGESLIVKGVHRCASRGFVELIVTELSAAPPLGSDAFAVRPQMRTDTVPFLGLEAEELSRMAREAGAGEITCFGGYHQEPYQRAESVDLLLLANKI